jgi:hypothetical protein
VSAQENSSTISTELSFELQLNDAQAKQYAEICKEALLRYDNLDEYRFVHENRVVSFQKIGISVTLLSAKSLHVSSGRFIQDACIDQGELYSEVEFRLFLQDGKYCIAPIFMNEKELICP